MSSPVTSRLAPFSKYGGPSTFDEALVSSIPPVVLTGVETLSAASTTPSVFVPWASVSSLTTISLGSLPNTISYDSNAVISLSDNTLYDPLDSVFVSTVTNTGIVVGKTGVYRFSGQIYTSLSTAIDSSASLQVDAFVNGVQVRRVDRRAPGAPSTLSANLNNCLQYNFVRPLIAGSTVSLQVSAGTLGGATTIGIPTRTFNTGAECYITRIETLVHAAPL